MKALVWFSAFCLVGCAPVVGHRIGLPKSAVLMQKGAPDVEGSSLLEVWEVRDSAALWTSQLPTDVSFQSFLYAVRRRMPSVMAGDLLDRATDLAHPADRENLQIVAGKAGEWVFPIRWLEAELLARQTRRRDMIGSPTEFLAFLLRSPDQKKLKIYSYTVNQSGIGGFGVPMEYVEKDLASGQWELWASLHNHNFFLDRPQVGGTVCPSQADLAAFGELTKQHQMREAWITNGFDTLRLPTSELPKLRIDKRLGMDSL